MSYSIWIGSAIPIIDENGFDWQVERVENEDAPNFSDSKLTNGRHPGYSQMYDFCQEAGVDDIFSNAEYGLLREHPGLFHLLPLHLEKMTKAKEDWEQDHPDAIGDFEDGHDFILARLIWYEFWMKWALENCEHPAVENY